MNPVIDKLGALWPEIIMLAGAVGCLLTGLSASAAMRRATAGIAAVALLLAGVAAALTGPHDITGLGLGGLTLYFKLIIVLLGLILLMVAANVPDRLHQQRQVESAPTFDPAGAIGGEFFAFFLFSLTGVMLTAGAGDLVWLFLALELTSLPTYVMVAAGRDRIDAQEAAVKYFFLGALSAATFLYGFALIYGATGFTTFAVYENGQLVGGIHHAVQEQIAGGGISLLMLTGLVLSIVGICFKIAAAPMHFYTPDVYQGASTPVTAFLALTPKAAGFAALILLLSLVGWPLQATGGPALIWVLWIIAALTMTVGNVLALLQHNVKRVLAYSSVAHSGYLLVALLAGPAAGGTLSSFGGGALGNGIAAILFYLVAYALATIAAFAVLGCIAARGEEAETYDDIAGLVRRHPLLGWTMILSMLSLLGFPPLVGFLGKVHLFTPALAAGFIGLVVIAVINSAISAGYYLRIAAVCHHPEPAEDMDILRVPLRQAAAAVAIVAAVLLGIVGYGLIGSAHDAATPASTISAVANATQGQP